MENYREVTEQYFETLKTSSLKYRGKVISINGLEKEMALSLVSSGACKRGGYSPAGVMSPIFPGVIEDSDGKYSISVVNPIRVGGSNA